MRQLLSQRARIPDPGAKPYTTVHTAPDAHWTPVRALAPVPTLTATPGGAFSEDVANYVLAGLVLDKVTGQSTASAIDSDLWTPPGSY
jgi:CubicO group peptidase (beta-lactamase class C family)